MTAIMTVYTDECLKAQGPIIKHGEICAWGRKHRPLQYLSIFQEAWLTLFSEGFKGFLTLYIKVHHATYIYIYICMYSYTVYTYTHTYEYTDAYVRLTISCRRALQATVVSRLLFRLTSARVICHKPDVEVGAHAAKDANATGLLCGCFYKLLGVLVWGCSYDKSHIIWGLHQGPLL